jgi:manganese transport protein
MLVEAPKPPSPSAPHSLEEIHSSVPVPRGTWRRFLAFSGPAFMVSVGYMDPGNWGTDLEAGSKFGYRLLWVLLLSNAMAVLLQSLATRLGVVTGRDLAQACRENYPRPAAMLLWVLCEIAIAACDLAEVIGTIIALKLLFGMAYLWGLLVAACDTLLLLALQRRGVRLLELLTLALISVIAVSFFVEIALARPDWAQVVRGMFPGLAETAVTESLYVAIGMLGATVMPHNLYLHSALVQTRAFPRSVTARQVACKYNLFDSIIALNGAFFVNAAILILAATKFFGQEVETLQDAHRLLPEVMGTTLASGLFAIALLASGQSSTFTGTLAGQVVMEGFVRLRVRPWVRRLLTRSIALLPALVVITLAGSEGGESMDHRLLDLLVLSQVILSFQLPFAIVPLVHFTSDRRHMGSFANGFWLKLFAWASAAVVVGLNGFYLFLKIGEWGEALEKGGTSALWLYGTLGPLALGLAGFLGWITFKPAGAHRQAERPAGFTPQLQPAQYRRIGVAVEFEGGDEPVLGQASTLARQHGATVVLLHVVEGLGAEIYGSETDDQESRSDRRRMQKLTEHLRKEGLEAEGFLGYGNPADELIRIAREQKLDMLVLGSHGHHFLADMALGQTVSPVLHKLHIPVLVVPNRPGAG